ncbi:MAG: zinc finger domain-containing protein [archaeon]
MIKTCITTNKILTDDFIEFKCPGCGTKIDRSLDARKRSLVYKCKECGFEGP